MADRKRLVVSASEFIQRFNVTHYFTLTYPSRRGWEGRYKAVARWLDALEWMQGRPLGWFRADESRFSGLGFPEIPEHHHGLLVDTGNLCCKTAEHLWREFGDARVERYEPGGGAIPYCLKHAFHESGDWALGGKALRSMSLGSAGRLLDTARKEARTDWAARKSSNLVTLELAPLAASGED